MAQDPVTDALFLEYKEMRQELRDLINSMNTNLQIGIAALVSVIGWGLSSTIANERVLASVPTIVIAFTAVHLLKTSAVNILGTYCQVLAEKIRRQLKSEERVLDWEGGILWEHISHPTSIVQLGFYLIFLLIASLFGYFSWRAYTFFKWTAILHGIEALFVLGYASAAIRWNLKNGRLVWLKRYGIPTA